MNLITFTVLIIIISCTLISGGGNARDYTDTSATVTFQAGATAGSQMCINIDINDDSRVENLENFVVRAMSSDTEVTFPNNGNTASVQITDNDGKFIIILNFVAN